MPVEILSNLAVPREENIIFVSPDLKEWNSRTDSNIKELKNIKNRLEAKNELLYSAAAYTKKLIGYSDINYNSDVIVTGHQAIWHHCGIWSKSVMADKFARCRQGCCLFLVLDHDICNTELVIPAHASSLDLTLHKYSAEICDKPVPLECRHVNNDIINLIYGLIENCSGYFCGHIWNKHLKHIKDTIPAMVVISDIIIFLQAILNLELGLNKFLYLPVSYLSHSNAFNDFLSRIIEDAYKFVKIYNESIRNQINTLNIKSHETLKLLEVCINPKRIELPFWFISKSGQRFSLYVMNNSDYNFTLFAGNEKLAQFKTSSSYSIHQQVLPIIKANKFRIRPKAISLSLFCRIYLSDWFIHGIGGARYEIITDYILEKYYKSRLSFGITTATMTLPLNNSLNENDKIDSLKQFRRMVIYSPEKFISPEELKDQNLQSLIEQKKDYIKTSRDINMTTSLRYSAWQSIKEINHLLRKKVNNLSKDLQKEINASEKLIKNQKSYKSREYFYGLFDEYRLRHLSDSILPRNF